MKDAHLILLLGLGAAAYLIKPAAKPAASKPSSTGAASSTGAQEIRVDGNAFGWRYFTDGTAIDPYGTYHRDGVAVWSPSM